MDAGDSNTYVGPDRRQPLTAAGFRPSFSRAAVAGVIVIAGWAVLALLAYHESHRATSALVAMALALDTGLLLAAAALRYSVWRMTGAARAAWTVIALTIGGFALPVIGMMTDVSGLGSVGFGTAAVVRGLVELALISVGAAALTSPAVVARLRPLRIAAPFVAGCLFLTALTVVQGPESDVGSPVAQLVAGLRIALVVLWIGLGLAFIATGRRRSDRTDVAFGCVLFLPALGSGINVLWEPSGDAYLLATAGAELIVCCAIAVVAAWSLWRLHEGQGTKLLQVAGELRGARTDLQRTAQAERQRLHDARNALLGLSGVTRVLTQDADQASLDRERLRHLMTSELTRLGNLLDPAPDEVTSTFVPANAIEPLILAHRLSGAHITTDLAECLAVGQADKTANAVSNILVNARKHAPGAQIWVRIYCAGDEVFIEISDDGPGIPPDEREAVVLPGVRGASSAAGGSGLGLASVAQAMAEQGGSVRLGERTGGGAVVTLDLPSAAAKVMTVPPIGRAS